MHPRLTLGLGVAACLAVALGGCSREAIPAGAIVLKEQGSFFVGGHEVKGEGDYEPTVPRGHVNVGNTFWVDQMYVQYQIPVNPRKYPLILVHGGGGTGRVWESTPDGREGFQSIFVRRGFPVYIVDFPRRGRSGYPSFNGTLGALDGKQLVPAVTDRTGQEYAWSRWRLGPKYPETFPVQQFPMKAVDSFMKHLVPIVADDPEVITAALMELCEKIGPAILVTHSQSGLFGWMVGGRSAKVKGIVSIEPGFVFPEDELPAPVPLFTGTLSPWTPMPKAEFARLAGLPMQVIYGDNIPTTPIADLVADGRRAQVVASKLFGDAIRKHGGKAAILNLPEIGIRGNSHFMFSDLNNIEVADQVSKFLSASGLDAR